MLEIYRLGVLRENLSLRDSHCETTVLKTKKRKERGDVCLQ